MLAAVVAAAVVTVVAAPIALRAKLRRPLRGDPSEFGLAFEALDFEPPDAPLDVRGWWMPAPHPKAAVILVHDAAASKAEPFGAPRGLQLAADLVARRYAVFAVDLRNHGESACAPDDRVTGGVAEANDVIGAVNALGRRFPTLRAAALGFSMGGAAAIYAAAGDRRIEAVVAEGTYADLSSVAGRFVAAATGLPRLLVAPILWGSEHVYGEPISGARPVDVVAAIAPRPLLVVCAEDDPVVPLAECARLARAAPSAEIWIPRGPAVDHPLAGTLDAFGTHARTYRIHPLQFVDRVTAFLDRTFAVGE